MIVFYLFALPLLVAAVLGGLAWLPSPSTGERPRPRPRPRLPS